LTDWIGAAEAARRLGIKQASLYAYVSRGLLSRRRDEHGRASMFDPAEVEQLARKSRPRRSSGPVKLAIETAVTEITDGTLRYRGYEATSLAGQRSFEDVAVLLWSGSLPEPAASDGDGTWLASPEALAAGRAAQAALPTATLPLERLQVIVPALAATDPFRLHLDPNAVMVAGRSLIAGMVDAFPQASGEPTSQAQPGSIAARLAVRLCTGAVSPGLARILDSALVLIADHDLAGSTLAARVAASMRADPYAVVATGLGAMGGALHGGAALGAEDILASASSPADASRLVKDVLRRGDRLPGFGHFVYEERDPRASLLLDLLGGYAPASPELAVALAVVDEMRGRGLPEPNVEFALAVLARVAGLTRGSGEAIFAIGRSAGWLAHAMEEYERHSPIRPRGVYTGRRGLLVTPKSP
jgi:citrate synthase